MLIDGGVFYVAYWRRGVRGGYFHFAAKNSGELNQ
jgi:hypothetical protein